MKKSFAYFPSAQNIGRGFVVVIAKTFVCGKCAEMFQYFFIEWQSYQAFVEFDEICTLLQWLFHNRLIIVD